jgi:hypothetical protein
LAERGESRAIEIGEEVSAFYPWARSKHPFLDWSATGFQEIRQAGPAFFEGAAFSLRIPNEVGDAKRWKFLAGVPRCKARDGSGAFVFPNPLSDFESLQIG